MCRPEVKELWVQIWVWAPATDVLPLGHISLDGTTLHADASPSHAVSDQRLLELAHQWRAEVDEWFALGEQAAQVSRPDGRIRADERARRQARLATWAPAQAVLEARAPERYQAERPESEAKRRARAETARPRQPRGPQPTPPQPGPRDRAQDHGTDPDSRLMKNSHHAGFDPHDHAHIATDPTSWLGVAHAWSTHAPDQADVEPTWAAVPEALGTPPAGALDTGDCRAAPMTALEQRGSEPESAVGREPPHKPWSASGAPPLAPPPEEASPLVQMASQRRPEIGQARYRWRQGTVEPVIGIITEVLGVRPCSRRGLTAAAGAWGRVCWAFKRKRLPVR
jgi:hypothetical protein